MMPIENTLWILGHGQLGAMMQHAAMPLGIQVRPIALDADITPDCQHADRVTAEIEKWPQTQVTEVLANHPNFINRDVFGRLADRLTQKQLLDQLNIATSPWLPLTQQTQLTDIYRQLGERALIKRRTGGYDGRGQHWLKQTDASVIPDDWRDAAIVEQGINFDEECAIVGARDASGNTIFYPLTLTLQVDGVLTAAIAPLPRLQSLQSQAENMLGKLLDELDYVGVLAMECFRVGDHLIVNELAPRVHNTAHWTQSGANISQFEQHLRAVTGLPLAKPTIKGLSVMINLLGTELDRRWWQVPGAEPYWYGKSWRADRKMGHINFTAGAGFTLSESLLSLETLLPEKYTRVIDWAVNALADTENSSTE